MKNQNGVKDVIKSKLNQFDQQQLREVARKAESGMNYSDFLTWIENEINQAKRMASFKHEILCFKNDGAYQLHRAIQEVFGVAVAAEDKSPSGSNVVETVDVRLADGTVVKVPYGTIALEGLGEGAEIKINYSESSNILYVKGSCQFRFSSLIDDIITRTRELLKYESIYRNQALSVVDVSIPKVMDMSNIDKELMVLSARTERELRPLLSRITKPFECTEAGVPLKYGALLEGPYGTGKTLLAFKLAAKAIASNWIFLYLKDPKMLAQTLRLCKVIDGSGHGALVFVEDIDQVTSGNRDAALQDILNTLDGGDTKGMNVICLFTTNHIEAINKTFLRGKRIGSVISLGALDKQTARKFVELSFGPSYTFDSPELMDDVYTKVESYGIVPAFMAEIVESVKTNLIFTENPKHITAADLMDSIESYTRQMGLSTVETLEKNPAERLGEALLDVLQIRQIAKDTQGVGNTIKKEWGYDEDYNSLS